MQWARERVEIESDEAEKRAAIVFNEDASRSKFSHLAQYAQMLSVRLPITPSQIARGSELQSGYAAIEQKYTYLPSFSNRV